MPLDLDKFADFTINFVSTYKKEISFFWKNFVAGAGIRTRVLWVMSPTLYHWAMDTDLKSYQSWVFIYVIFSNLWARSDQGYIWIG